MQYSQDEIASNKVFCEKDVLGVKVTCFYIDQHLL